MCMEWVAGSPWNRWPDAHGISGRMAVEYAALNAASATVAKRALSIPTKAKPDRLQASNAASSCLMASAWDFFIGAIFPTAQGLWI